MRELNLTQPQQLGWSTGSDWEKSDIWLLETCVQYHARSEKIGVSKMSGLEDPSDAQTKYLGPEPVAPHETFNWVPVADDGKS